MQNPETITVTEQDHQRLRALAAHYADIDATAAELLDEELDRANIVPATAVETSRVTMNSRVTVRMDGGKVRDLELVYPRRADASLGRVSVLAPLGRALLGAAVGDDITVRAGGRTTTWRIEAIHYQPEAAGDYEL